VRAEGLRADRGMLAGIDEKIERYLRDLPPGVLDRGYPDSIEILEMMPGAYNLNFHIRVDGREFVFRINIEQQSGLPNQVEYEFAILRFLEPHRLAPKAYYCDNKRDYFDFGILIEQYLQGPHLSLDMEEMPRVAELLARLHSLGPRHEGLVVWQDPLADTYDLVQKDLKEYQAKRASEQRTIGLAKRLLDRAEPSVDRFGRLFAPASLNHTDVVCDNFVKTTEGLRLIDWEKPRIDDSTYDLCCFLSEPAQLWCSQRVLDPGGRESFLKTYADLTGENPDRLWEKVRIREPLVSLHWILWGATKLCDLRERRTVPELLTAHEEKTARYERIAHPDNIERLLGSS